MKYDGIDLKGRVHIHASESAPCKGDVREQCEFMHVHPDTVARLIGELPAEGALGRLSDFFKVLGDSTRLKILLILRGGELCVCDIAAALSMSQSAVSHQLRVLKQMRLVKSRRDGKTVFYSLDDMHVQTIILGGLEHVME